MTTQIIVKAHCADDKEVKVTVKDPPRDFEETFILQDGEEKDDLYAYDDREIVVREQPKPKPE